MARPKKDNRGPLQRSLDNERVAGEQSFLDVLTPEQIASGDYANENGGRRYFRLRHLDRLHKNGKLTYEQHQAGAHYRELYDLGRYDSTRTADLTRIRGENVVHFTLPTKAQDARDQWHAARKEIQARYVGIADAFLIRDKWPKLHHRRQATHLTAIRCALDTLAAHFRYI